MVGRRADLGAGVGAAVGGDNKVGEFAVGDRVHHVLDHAQDVEPARQQNG